MGISGRFISGHRLSDALGSAKSAFPSGAKVSLVVLLLTLLFSPYTLADNGADTYKTRCAACHGSNGAGETMLGKNKAALPRFRGSAETIGQRTRCHYQQGQEQDAGPLIANSPKNQIGDVVKYVRSLKK
jgi:mono/diheme cytochrome c family protein